MYPLTKVLLKIDKALQDEIVTDSGLKFYLDGSFRKEWTAAPTATIAHLPVKVPNKQKNILSKLQIGDEVCVSFRVVADFQFQGDSHRFMPSTEDNPYLKEFYNGLGESIRIYALPKRSGFKGIVWVAAYLDKRGELINGTQGSESDIERWQSQFQFGKTDDYQFNNLISVNGEDYWQCDLSEIFAVRKDGKLHSVGDRVIGLPVDEKVPKDILHSITHTGEDIKVRFQDRLRALTGGEEKMIKKNDIVSFSPNHLEKYQFFGKEYYMIHQNFINGIWKN